MVAIVLLEVLVLSMLAYNAFQKALLDSFIVNFTSLIAGFVFLAHLSELVSDNTIQLLLLSFLITIILEIGMLYLLNKSKPFRKTFVAGLLMNTVTYILLFLIFLRNVS